MALTDSEIKSLKVDILRLKEKISSEKELVTFAPVPNANGAAETTENSEKLYRMKLNPPAHNFKLTSVKLYDDVTKEEETKLVYTCNNVGTALDDKIKQQVDDEFGSDLESDSDAIGDLDHNDYDESFKEFMNSIKIDELLRPITKPSDVVNIKPVSQIYKAKFLSKLSNNTVELIEREQEMVNLLNKTMDIFLNANPEHLAADNLGLPEYDHKLDLEKVEQGNSQDAPDTQACDDPFFKPPNYESNPGFDDIHPDEIDETRHLLQIALQRNEEYIRSLMQIRSGFLHADNYREQIYMWCKEMNENEINQ